jgi:hypothetical protein
MKDSFFLYYPIKKVKIVDTFTNRLQEHSLEIILDSYIEKQEVKPIAKEEIVNTDSEQDTNHYVTIVIIMNTPIYNNRDNFIPERLYLANFNVIVDSQGYLPTFQIPLDDDNFKYKQFIRKQIANYLPDLENHIKTIKKIDVESEYYHNYLVLVEPYDYGIQSISYRRDIDKDKYFLDNLTFLFTPDKDMGKKETNLKYIVENLIKNGCSTSKRFIDSISHTNIVSDIDILLTIRNI